MQVSMDPKTIAERGAEVYAQKYKTQFEAEHPGRFAAIDIQSEEAFVADTPEDAIRKGQESKADGVFHVIKIGSSGVFRIASCSGGSGGSWIFGR